LRAFNKSQTASWNDSTKRSRENVFGQDSLSLDDARRLVTEYIDHYDTVRLHRAIGYIAPIYRPNGRDKEIFKERDRKLEAAWEQRRMKGQEVFEKYIFLLMSDIH
jgi:hypothetical protein